MKGIINMSNITKLSGEVEYKKPSWLRVIEVKLYSRLTPDKIVYGNYQNPDNDYLNISIAGTKKLSSNQNTCTIKITNLIAHLNQVEYSTLAKARPPIIAPHVGLIKLTKPFAAIIVIIVTSTL